MIRASVFKQITQLNRWPKSVSVLPVAGQVGIWHPPMAAFEFEAAVPADAGLVAAAIRILTRRSLQQLG